MAPLKGLKYNELYRSYLLVATTHYRISCVDPLQDPSGGQLVDTDSLTLQRPPKPSLELSSSFYRVAAIRSTGPE